VSLADELAACDVETVKAGGLRAFTKIVWPQMYGNSPLQWNWHLDLILDHYEACFKGEIPELVVNVPPNSSKSSLTSTVFPAWGWIKNPGASWIFAAYGQKIVRRDAEIWRNLLLSPWWAKRWGQLFVIPNVSTVDLIKNNKGGFRLGTTPGGEATGFHGNFQVIDDPNKPEELTKVGLENVKGWLTGTMGSRWRKPPEVNSLICIMQRLHCDDLSAMLLERGAMHICLPANYDPSRKTLTTYGEDPRTKPGELLDPVRLPQKLIDKLRRDLGGMNAAAQLDQNPVPEGGAVFKREDIQYWTTLHIPDIDKRKYVRLPPTWDQVVDSWDCAFKAEDDNDFVAGQKWGRSGTGMFLLAQKHGHFDFVATQKNVLLLASEEPKAPTVLIEDKANGPAIIVTLTSVMPGLVAVDPRGGKFARAASSTGFFQAGNVYFPDPRMPGYEWVANLLEPEVLSFPRAKKDDQVDAMTQCLLYLHENTNYLAAAMAVVRRNWGVIDI
jgi:predicted phage terminase large subunit-like protein